MNVFRFLDAGGRTRIGRTQGAAHTDVTEALGSIGAWLALPDPLAALAAADGPALDAPATLLAPIDTSEVWASGVTYERSKVARMEESEGGGDFYDKVYLAERPELFGKGAGWRTVAPGQPIRVRRDSRWDVPEPELTLVCSAAGQIVGATVGNDVSSRSIEGENPLYLPQAKVYDGSCALGPTITTLETPRDLRALEIRLTILRDGEAGFDGVTSTARMRRSPEELVGFLFAELSFPDGVFLMTGTGIVPPDDFTLRAGDTVRITIDGLGTLENPVA